MLNCFRTTVARSNATRTTIVIAATMLTTLGIHGCKSAPEEVKVKDAEPGDILVIVDGASVELTHPFKPGLPNGLYDGGVVVKGAGNDQRQVEVNAICSMPDLPNWPEYDNIYGRWLEDGEEPGVAGGDTDWQLLMHFDGKEVNKGKEKAPSWAKRLASNLCRKGDFQDTKPNTSNN